MSKSYYLCCKSLHLLPKFASKPQGIQVGNGQYVSVPYIIPIITDIHGHIFEIYTLVLKLVDILWNRTSLEVVDKLSSTTVDFIRSERELENMHLYGV